MRAMGILSVSAALLTVLAFSGRAASPQEGSSEPGYVAWPLPADGQAYADIDGKHLWQYVKDQADISRNYRDQGHPQYWGRIAGTSGDVESAQWLLANFKRIGLADVHAQTVAFFDPQWAPQSWEVTASAGGQTLKLASAQPPYGDVDTGGKVLDVPVAYVGLGSEADFAGRDVRGKAVLVVRGEIGYGIAPADVMKRAEDKGAVAILGTDLRGGNFKALAYRTNAKVPTFNLGTEDGLALRDLIAKAGNDAPHVQLRLDATWASDQKSFLVWGTLPGATDETIYIVAHRDGWFDGAGDNASGVATMLGIAEHFAKIPQAQRKRTIIFIGLDGHHHVPQGAYGTTWLYENRARLFGKTALLINCEHPAEVLTHSGILGRTEEVIPMWWYAGGQTRPKLKKIALDAFHAFGVPLWVEERTPSGDVTPFMRDVPAVIAQSSDFMHMHTDGDSPDVVSWAGLEAAARAYAKVIDEVNKLPLSDLQRPPETPAYTVRLDLTNCAAWIKDSGAACKPRR